MIYQGAEFSIQDLFEELRQRAKNEKTMTLAGYSDLVDELVEEKKNYGFFSDDEDIVQIKTSLKDMWPLIEKDLK